MFFLLLLVYNTVYFFEQSSRSSDFAYPCPTSVIKDKLLTEEKNQEEKIQEMMKASNKLVPNNKLLVYNRLPKCASTTTLQIITRLKTQLRYSVLNDIAPAMPHLMKSDEQEFGLL